LAPEARHRLGLRLTGPTAAALGQSPPAGVHHEAFLVSAVAAYQQRHGGPATWMFGPAGAPPPVPWGPRSARAPPRPTGSPTSPTPPPARSAPRWPRPSPRSPPPAWGTRPAATSWRGPPAGASTR